MIWLVSPAHGRYDLSEITMAQWATLPVEVVVIADDENLDIARGHGFHTVEQNNDLLGRRYNDGFQYAFFHGATFAGESGTRNLIHPDLLAAMPWSDGKAQSGNLYTIATPSRAETFFCRNSFGRGPLFLPRSILERNPRPVDDGERKLILHSICANTSPEIEFTNVHDFQYVGLYRPGESELTSREDYENRWGVARTHGIEELEEWF